MAVRLDAAGDYLQRAANLPSNTAFTASGWCRIISDQGSGTLQPLFVGVNGSTFDAFGLYWEQSTSAGSMRVFSALAGAEASGTNFASRPAVGEDFFWYVRCSGSGAGQLEAGFRKASETAFTVATATMAGVAGINDWRIGNVIATYWLDSRHRNVKVWDRALSQAELLVESYFERTKFPASLNFHWPLTGATDTADRGGLARNPTVGGTLTTEDLPVNLWRPRRRVLLPASSGGASATASQAVVVFGQSATAAGVESLTASQAVAAFGQSATLAGVESLTATQAAAPFGQTAVAAAVEALTASQAAAPFGQSATAAGVESLTASQAAAPFGQSATAAGVEALTASQAAAPFGQAATVAGVESLTATQAAAPFGQSATAASGTTANVGATQELPTLGQAAAAAGVEALTASQAAAPFGQAATAAGVEALTASQPFAPLGQAATAAGVEALTASQALPALDQSATAQTSFPALSVSAAQELPTLGQLATVHNDTPAAQVGGGGLAAYEIALQEARARRLAAEQQRQRELEQQAAEAARQAIDAAAAPARDAQRARDREAAERRAMRRAVTQAGVEALQQHLAQEDSLRGRDVAEISAMHDELQAAIALQRQHELDEIAISLLTLAVQ